MTDPQQLLQDPFVQQLITIKGQIEALIGIYLQQGVQTTMPFTNQIISAALNTSSQGVNILNTALQQGVIDIQAAVATVAVPVIVVKGGGPVGGGAIG